MQRWIAFVRLGRPHFLVGGFLLYGLGAAVAASAGHSIDTVRYGLGQAVVSAFQLMTHYANDYFDFETDVANTTPTRWSGGSRVLPAAELPRRAALVAAVGLAALGAGLGIALLLTGAGGWTAPTVLAAFVLAWGYSAPPLRLCARGAGEVTTALVVTGLVPWLGFSLQAPDLDGTETLLFAIVPLALLQFAMLLSIEFPDARSDAHTGKRTLVVRLGAAKAARLYAAATIGAYAWIPVALLLGLPTAVGVGGMLLAPVAAWRVAAVGDCLDPARHERLAVAAVFLLVATAGAELAGFVFA